LIGTGDRSKRNIIGYEVDGSVQNEVRIRIKLTAIKIIRMVNDDLGTRSRKSWNGSRRGRWNFERQFGQSKE
jgi:hypothetical protein